jgi:carboxyl-terminal processing protease
MLPADVMGVGQEITAPNMMVTPIGVPVVGINLAMNVTKVPPCVTILFTVQPALNMGSIAPVTISIPPMIPPCLPGMHIMGIPTILLQCLPATNMAMCPAIGNGGCAPAGATLVPNVTTVMLMYAEVGEARTASDHLALTIEDLRAIERSLSGPMVESAMLSDTVGYVRIRRFSAAVPSCVHHAIRLLENRGMESLLVDLRGNPGGEMHSSIQLAGDFLEPGSVIATMTDADGDDVVYRSPPGSTTRCPVVLLVDRGTASAAELFAGSLKAHGRATVVGARTYGKGDVQAVVVSSENEAIYGTAGRVTLAGGLPIQGHGVNPDLPWPSRGIEAPGAETSGRLPTSIRNAILSLKPSDSGLPASPVEPVGHPPRTLDAA